MKTTTKTTSQLAIFLVLLLVLTPFAFASELQLKKVSDLQPGDVIVDKTGKEIPVESIQPTDYKISTNLIQILTGKLSANPMTGNIVAPITGHGALADASANIKAFYELNPDGTYSEYLSRTGGDLVKTSDNIKVLPKNANMITPYEESLQIPPATNNPTSVSPSEMTNSFTGASSKTLTGTVQSGTYTSGGLNYNLNGETLMASVPEGGSMQVLAPTTEGGEWTAKITDANGGITTESLGTDPPIAANEGLTMTTTQEGSSATSRFFGAGGGGIADTLLTGLQWAAIGYFAGQMLGPMLGLDDDQTDTLSYSLAAGGATYGVLSSGAVFNAQGATSFSIKSLGSYGNAAGWIGIAIAVVVFVATYEDTKEVTVTFTCQPWQAPNGGNNCEVCNDDDLPCSEYRCKSLGQACELVNQGTTQEKCVYVNPKDVLPPVITPNDLDLPANYKYTNVKLSPPGPGFTITNLNSSDGCVPAFTPLTFGITTDEPSQCKIDFNHTEKLDDMNYWMGGSNLYKYNHSEQFSLPGPANLNDENLTIDNGGKWTFFIRCKDKNGNENVADYALRFCVDPTPDETAPLVKATSIENTACVAADTQNASVSFYLNEPSTCKWSKSDQTYDNMQNTMVCSNRLEQMNALQLYACTSNLDSISRDGTNYFIRCQDKAGNKMATSYEFNLKGSTPLLIKTAKPNETVFGGVNPAPVELFVQTNYGCEESKAACAYSFTGNKGDYILFSDTNNEDGINTQKLYLSEGSKTVYIKCVDAGGNVAETKLEFNVEIDTNAPVVARAYEEDDLLKIVTVRDSECAYTNDNCDFLFDEGIEMPYANTTTHITEWLKDQTYYIKCRDEFKNDEADCSIIVKSIKNFL